MTFFIAKTLHILFPNHFAPARDFKNKLKFNAEYVCYHELHISGLNVVINKDAVPHCLLCMDFFNP